ncbi:MAG: hypothetical protein M3Z21_02715 [Pseudomonadota bacterium]|nr:hypothetical protein [Pseudomonadota bacterium]
MRLIGKKIADLFNAVLIAAAGAAVAGCATEPRVVEADFGASYRQMVQAQRYEQLPLGAGVSGLDGDKAAAVMDAYRKDVAKPEEIPREININQGR